MERKDVIRLVYIAGPFRAPTVWETEQNIRRAEDTAAEVAKAGAWPVTPHKEGRSLQGVVSDEFALEGTKEVLRRCDALFKSPGWERSDGARAEIEEMRRLEKPVFFSLSDLRDWLTS